MSMIPNDLRYTKEHEWVKFLEGKAIVGITDYAQNELTDVVYVELPETGKEVAAGDEVVVLESVKAASEVYAPVGGAISEVNAALEEKPELINEDPYGEGWIVAIKMKDEAELESLLSPEEYRELVAE